MTSREWEELKALSRLEPIGPDRRDLGIARAVAHLLLGWGAKPEQIDLTDYLPIRPPPPPPMTIEEEYAAAFAYSQRHNAKLNGRNNHQHVGSQADPG